MSVHCSFSSHRISPEILQLQQGNNTIAGTKLHSPCATKSIKGSVSPFFYVAEMLEWYMATSRVGIFGT